MKRNPLPEAVKALAFDALIADLRELLQASDAHKAATEAFLSAPQGGGQGQGVLEPWAGNLERTANTLNDKAHEVAAIVRQLGFTAAKE